MKKCLIDRWQPVPPHNQAAEVAEPSESPFNGPAATVPPQRTAVLRRWPNATTLVRSHQLYPTTPEAVAQRVAVIRLVGDQPIGFLPRPAGSRATRDSDGGQRLFDERDFRRGRRLQVVSQRKTLAVDHHHPLRTLAPLGFPDFLAPFFAGAKLPSINASLQSNCRRSSNWPRNVRQISSQTPCSSHAFSRRQHVEGDDCSSVNNGPLRATGPPLDPVVAHLPNISPMKCSACIRL